MVEGQAEGDGRGLDGGEIWRGGLVSGGFRFWRSMDEGNSVQLGRNDVSVVRGGHLQ